MPQLLPAELAEAAAAVPKTMPRSPGHHEEWVEGCKSGRQPTASFAYSGPMTEIALLGVLSLRAPGQRLQWDSEHLRVTNVPEVNQYVNPEYRAGWTLYL
jgi:hypothetical protein